MTKGEFRVSPFYQGHSFVGVLSLMGQLSSIDKAAF